MFTHIVEIDHKDRDQMLSRRQARRFALQVLFSYEFLQEDIDDITSRISDMLSHEVDHFSLEIIRKTHDHLEELDKHILNSLKDRDINRVPVLDKVLIRQAVCELLYFPDIPIEVTINEAVELSKEFISLRSSRFTNGILDAIYKKLEQDHQIKKSLLARIPARSLESKDAVNGIKK
jgi:N utilization substance protein B